MLIGRRLQAEANALPFLSQHVLVVQSLSIIDIVQNQQGQPSNGRWLQVRLESQKPFGQFVKSCCGFQVRKAVQTLPPLETYNGSPPYAAEEMNFLANNLVSEENAQRAFHFLTTRCL